MSDTKLIQAILDNQVSMREDIRKLNTRLSKQIKGNTDRLDKIGKSLAYLEDDAPTREEFEELADRVQKIENCVASL